MIVGVYEFILCPQLYENEEFGYLRLQELPHEFGFAAARDFFHIGGHKACLDSTSLSKTDPNISLAGTHKSQARQCCHTISK
jgi:hypothetical protein